MIGAGTKVSRRRAAQPVDNNFEAELVAARALLARQDQLRVAGEVAIGIGHDVNNLLGALDLRLRTLFRDRDRFRGQEVDLLTIERILQDGMALVSRLQNLARTSKSPLRPLDLGEVVKDALCVAASGLRLGAAESRRSLRFEVQLDAMPLVIGYAEELRNVFMNLLINARDAMPEGGAIHVDATVVPSWVYLRVWDEGTGIPAAALPHVFDAFFTTKPNGTGMGLAMAKAIMERVGGAITARNLAGAGACFELRFRRADATPRTREPARRVGATSMAAP